MAPKCPSCARPVPAGTRAQYCPACSLRGALELPDHEERDATNGGATAGAGVNPALGREGGSSNPVTPGAPPALEDFELLDCLGRGGMGVVYRARQRSLDRLVAVKLLLGGTHAGEDARRRFASEARAAAGLRHPHIVTIYEIGDHHGEPYFAMELIQGLTLAEVARAGPLPPKRAAALLRAVAEGVDYAHVAGVLHRDLKPSNILLDGTGAPKVTDFGLARPIDTAERLTLTGEVLGSPAYLSPEQARGDRALEGIGSDIYSLGAVLYELLCGRPPFLGDSPASVLQQVAEADPVSPRRLNPAIPRDLETVCLKCLERAPAHRYRSANELAADLRRFEHGEPVRAQPVGLWGRAWRWSRRHPARAGLAATLAMLVATLVLVPTAAYVRVRQAETAREVLLGETLIAQAQALRQGGQPGQRLRSERALDKAIQLRRHLSSDAAARWRRELAASLALPDAVSIPALDLPMEADETYLSVAANGRVAHGSFRGPLRLLNRPNGRELARIDLPPGKTLQHVLEFDPSGRYLAVRHGPEISISDLEKQATVVTHPSWLHRYSFHPSGTNVAFLATNGAVVAFTLPEGTEAWRWTLSAAERTAGGAPSIPSALAFAPDGRRVAVGLESGAGVRICDTATGRVGFAGRISGSAAVLAWSASGRWLAAGSDDGSIRLWEFAGPTPTPNAAVATGDLREWSFEAHAGPVRALAFSPDDAWLTSAGHDELVRFWSVATGRAGLAFSGVAFQLGYHDGGRLLGPVWRGREPRWLVLTNSTVYTAWRARPSAGAASGAVLLPDTTRLAVTQPDGVRILRFPGWEPVSFFPFAKPTAVYAPRAGELLTIGWNGLELRSTAVGGTNDHGAGTILGARDSWPAGLGGDMASFDASGEMMAVANYLRDEVWLGPTRTELARRKGRTFPHRRVASVALSPDRRWLAAGAVDVDPIRVWDANSGIVAQEWPANGDLRLAFSPDGRWLAQFGLGCRLWNVGSNAPPWQPGPPLPDIPRNSTLGGAAFSPDGRMLAVTGADAEIHLVSLPGAKVMAVLEAPHRLRINHLTWASAGSVGSHLVATTMQGEVQVWAVRDLLQRLPAGPD